MMTEASSETIRPYVFKTDSLCMIAGIAREKKPFEDVFRIYEDLEVKGDKENFSEEKVLREKFPQGLGLIPQQTKSCLYREIYIPYNHNANISKLYDKGRT